MKKSRLLLALAVCLPVFCNNAHAQDVNPKPADSKFQEEYFRKLKKILDEQGLKTELLVPDTLNVRDTTNVQNNDSINIQLNANATITKKISLRAAESVGTEERHDLTK